VAMSTRKVGSVTDTTTRLKCPTQEWHKLLSGNLLSGW